MRDLSREICGNFGIFKIWHFIINALWKILMDLQVDEDDVEVIYLENR